MPEPQSFLEPEFAEPFDIWRKSPTPATAGGLLRAVQPVIDKALTTYVGTPSPTMRSRARAVSLKALRSYDPGRAKLRTHLMTQLQSLRRASRREGQIISLPERVALDLQYARSASAELRDQLGRDPNDIELADHTGLSRARLRYIRNFKPPMAEGALLSRTLATTGDVYQPAVAQQAPGDDDPWLEFVYHDLGDTDRNILEWSLGLHGQPTLSNQQIAEKLRLTPAAISQRRARIQARLDQRDELLGT